MSDKDEITLVEHGETPATRIVVVKKRLLTDGTTILDRQVEVQGHTLKETEACFKRLKKELE